MSFASPFPQVQIPDDQPLRLPVRRPRPTRTPTASRLVDAKSGAETTYRDMVARIDAFAGALAARGIGVGDVVGLLAPNSSAFAIAFHGILRAGATATTINALFTAKDIAKQLTDCEGHDARHGDAAAARRPPTAPPRSGWPTTRSSCSTVPARPSTGIPTPTTCSAPALPAPEVTFDPATHLAALPYSSGTTGNPKGVMLTHRNLAANVAQIRPLQGMRADDRILAVLPFFHIYGMTVLLNAALHARARLVIMPSFDLAEFLGNIARYASAPIAFIAPPGRGRAGQASPGRASTTCPACAASCPARRRWTRSSASAVTQRLGCQVVQGYGMSELSPVSHVTPFDGGRELVGIGGAAELVRLDGAQRRQQDRRLRDRRRNRPSRIGSQRDRRAVVQGSQRDGRLPRQRRGHPRDHRRRRLPAHRRRGAGRLDRLRLHRRPAQGTHQVQGLPGAARRTRGRAADPPGRSPTPPSSACTDAESGEEVPKAFVVKQSGAELPKAR